MGFGEPDYLRRPLGGVLRRSTDARTIADAPAVTAAFRRLLNVIRLSVFDPTITQKFIDAVFDVNAIDYSQAVDRSRPKLIERVGIERVLRCDSGEISAQSYQAQAAYNNAKLQFDRIKNLFTENAATQMEMDQATLGLESATAGLNAAKAMEGYTKITAPIAGPIAPGVIQVGSPPPNPPTPPNDEALTPPRNEPMLPMVANCMPL